MASVRNGTATNGTNGCKVIMTEPPMKKQAKSGELEDFDALFPQLVEDLANAYGKDKRVDNAVKWFTEVSNYNVPFGKKNRGMMVSQAYRSLKGSDVTEGELKLARVLGWCIEWLQAYFLVADDIMDQSSKRRGKPCWYKVEGVGFEAVNDALFLESAVFILLKKYFRSLPCYVDLLELFHESSHQTITGQCMDMTTAPTDRVDFTDYTPERYYTIVEYKTAYYSFYLPVACAMYMAGITDEDSHANAKAILVKMGTFFQIQDDYLDVYGDPEVMGKVGVDIEENKCGWMVIQALQRATPEEKKILQENYAQHDPAKVAKVKELYAKLNLKKVYEDYEETSYEEIIAFIEAHRGSLPSDIFVTFAKKIYKRDK